MIAGAFAISFILEGVFSNLVSNNSLLIPFFTITSLTILYPYFNNHQIKFMGSACLLGFFYDIIYTNSLFVNTFSFVAVSVAIIIIYNYINMNWININILSIIIVLLYKAISYLLLCIIGYLKFNSNTLAVGLYNSIIINIIYGLILYAVTYNLGKKLNLKRLE